MAGVEVYESWFSSKAEKTGLIPLPGKNESLQGGHAICVTGYNDTKKLFTFKNSWGDDWADKGYGYLRYEYMEKFCLDAWSGTDLIADPHAIVKKREEVLRRYA
jgi:C1A family cysteine protease